MGSTGEGVEWDWDSQGGGLAQALLAVRVGGRTAWASAAAGWLEEAGVAWLGLVGWVVVVLVVGG